MRFLLSDIKRGGYLNGVKLNFWDVKMISPEYKLIATFPGCTDPKGICLENEIARAVAGDYAEFLNEKYIDKEINEEWPAVNNEQYFEYHLNRLQHFASKIGKRVSVSME